MFFPLARARLLSCLYHCLSPSSRSFSRHGAINVHKEIPTKYIKPVRRFRNQLARLNSEASRSSRRRLIFSTSIDESSLLHTNLFFPSPEEHQNPVAGHRCEVATDSSRFQKFIQRSSVSIEKKKRFRRLSHCSRRACPFPEKTSVGKTSCSRDRYLPARSFPVSFAARDGRAPSPLLCSQNVLASRALTAN